MILKIYKALWLVGILMAAGVYFAGMMTEMMEVIFGFLTFGMVFMGMISVLPVTISHPELGKRSEKVEAQASAPSVSHAHPA